MLLELGACKRQLLCITLRSDPVDALTDQSHLQIGSQNEIFNEVSQIATISILEKSKTGSNRCAVHSLLLVLASL